VRAGLGRHLLSVALLPGTVLIVVPWWLLRSGAHGWSTPLSRGMGAALGLLVFTAGLLLFARCVALFARAGHGTLAPWDPTQRLVASGPYARMRNPMITGVATMLLGEALFFGSWRVGAWLIAFVIINHVYFITIEEPGLRRRFGAAWREYAATVPRWIPRR
jgi:protein-S-isoprenylcysteine O-methyltransferase Ste14